MYRLLFDDDTIIEVPTDQAKGLKLGLAHWNGKDAPKYMYLWFKIQYIEKHHFKEWENSFWYKKLLTVFKYDETGTTLLSAIKVPEPFIELHYEEGDLVVVYGNQLYSDEA